MQIKRQNFVITITCAAAAFIANSAYSQVDPSLKEGQIDSETMMRARQKMIERIKKGEPKEQTFDIYLEELAKEKKDDQVEQLSSMASNLKNIKVGLDTKDDVVAKLGKPLGSQKRGEFEIWSYAKSVGFGAKATTAVASVQFDATGRVTYAEASKRSANGLVEKVYSVGNLVDPDLKGESLPLPSTPTLVNRSNEAPMEPQEGQIYYNTLDKCFYGWNGMKWMRLDN